MTEIEKYISNKVVVTSGMVIKYCVDTLCITEANARKRVQRLPESIYKIKGICKDKQSILYHKDNWGNEEFYEILVDILQSNAFQHYAVINGLVLNYGSIQKEKLASLTVSPVMRRKGHRDFVSIISDLKKMRLIEETTTHFILQNYSHVNDNKSKVINTLQSITINQFQEWARNIGLISYKSARFDAIFSSYQFGLVAPSYIKSLISKSGIRTIPAFVVSDIVLKNDIKETDILFFIKKIQNISTQNQAAKFLPFILITSHNAAVYQALKKEGIIVGNLDELFGKKYTETILGIFNLIENAGAILKTNPNQYIKLLDNIEKLAIGKTYNLKGDLFEMVVGYFHGQLCQNIEVSKNIYYDSKSLEIDVYAVYQDKVVFAECKGYTSAIDDKYIEQWLSIKIPTMKDWALSCESLNGKRLEFEIWCTGGFTQESIELLDAARAKTRKYSIDYFDQKKMCATAKDKNIRHFNKIMKTYYIKEV